MTTAASIDDHIAGFPPEFGARRSALRSARRATVRRPDRRARQR